MDKAALEALRAMARSESEDVPWWKGTSPEEAEEGDWIAGTVTAIRSVESSRGGTFPLLVLDTPSGTVAVACSRSVLEQKVEEKGIEVGDTVSVEYLGLSTSRKSGNEYHNYAVGVNKSEASAE
jgi:hypothetical protein